MRNILARLGTEKNVHQPDHEVPPGVPRWVKALAIIALVLFLLFAFLRFTGMVGDLSSLSGTSLSTLISPATRVQGGQPL